MVRAVRSLHLMTEVWERCGPRDGFSGAKFIHSDQLSSLPLGSGSALWEDELDHSTRSRRLTLLYIRIGRPEASLPSLRVSVNKSREVEARLLNAAL